ncbi:MAG TPA: hypothetical protein VMG10_32845 [Gemmataceae bacterium]|nr:hypothetical protein [Gemmataceae bacterium]
MKPERWSFVFELPAEAGEGDRAARFMARLLKHLLRVWHVRCVANRVPEAGAEPPSAAEAPREPAGVRTPPRSE